VARRGKYPPRVAKHLHLFRMMQLLIDCEMAPNAAARQIAAKHWRETSASYPACVQWLKDNERKLRDDLRKQFLADIESGMSGVPYTWTQDDEAVKKFVRTYMYKRYPDQMRKLQMFLAS
jgi:hypothetical protein